MAVLTAGDSDGAIVVAGAVAAAVFIAQGLKLLPAGIPVHVGALVVMGTGGADTLFVKGDTRTSIRHGAAFAVFHNAFLLVFCF